MKFPAHRHSWLAAALLVALAAFPPRSSAENTISDPAVYAEQLFQLTNAARAANGVPPLNRDSRLDRAATLFSQYMGTAGFFGHVGPDGVTPDQRMRLQGYNWSWWGENIAWGYWSPQEVMDVWMASPVHRANILNGNFKDIGVGIAFFLDSNGVRVYMTQDFGAPLATPPPPAASGKLSLSALSVAFPPTTVRTTAVRTLTLRNAGAGTLTGSVGSLRAPYAVTRGGGTYALAPSATRVIEIRFTPTARGTSPAATLAITSSDPAARSVSVRVTGSGR
jgi:uncharacterized protein YkwD